MRIIAIIFPILSIELIYSLDCGLQPILNGVSVKQDLGATRKKIIVSEVDCKKKCFEETDFNCNAILWPAEDAIGDCYLLDKVDLTKEIFLDKRPYTLYVSVCENEQIPSIGYCQFLLTQTGVTKTTSIKYESPGATTESSCHEFCISNYRGLTCNAFVVSSERASQCTLYESSPDSLESGTQNLWTKKCSAPPTNCEYSAWSEWSTCSVSCDGGARQRYRQILKEASPDGVQCLQSETQETTDCGVQECASNCVYDEWTSFGICNSTCSVKGIRIRTRNIVSQGNMGGQACDKEQNTDIRECEIPSSCSSNPSPCMYSTWSVWSECSNTCESFRERQLEMGDLATCEIENGPLKNTITCTGGSCGEKIDDSNNSENGNGGDNNNNNNENGAEHNGITEKPYPEIGCRIESVDPSSRPSSIKYKAVGTKKDCSAACAQETDFGCQAYITAGPGKPCILYGKIDQSVIQLKNSQYYMQDINCNIGKLNAKICKWEITKVGIAPNFSTPENYASIGLTIDSNHCGTLCMMNHPIFKPKPCKAFAWNPFIGFTSSIDNCFMYNVDALSNLTENGQYDLYQLIC